MSRVRTCCSTLILTLLIWPAVAAADEPNPIADLAARYAAEHRFSGSVLVAREGEVIFEGGFGEAERAFKVPNQPDTVFLVGSVSKQFTSMVILQLVAEGKMELDDPLSKFLPDYPADKAGLTIHQLLSHSSGMPHYAGIARLPDVDLEDYLRLDRPVSSYVELIGRLELLSEPGTEYSYSSMGYIVLAYIAELVSGKSYSQLLEERIAKPLGVTDLGFAYDNRLVDRLASGYMYDIQQGHRGELKVGYFPEPYRDQTNKYSTGGVHASVRALFRWARAIVGDELLEPTLRKRMFTPQSGSYGYGWRIEPGSSIGIAEEVEVISHGGSLSGYKASILILDRGRYTIIALGNSSTSRSGALTQGIARLLWEEEAGPANVFGTAVALHMVRDGIEAGRSFFNQQKEAGFADYAESEFAFYIYGDTFADLDRPDYGLALVNLGLEVHPDSAMLQLALAVNHHAAGESDAARAAAEEALRLTAEGGDNAAEIQSEARRLLSELEAEELKVAVGY
jgi:CubicO group peptidase (beta-lactamase class C family)